jgi:hypothetical protein
MLIGFAVVAVGGGVFFMLQYSALEISFRCQRLQNECVLSRRMVIGGVKEERFTLGEMERAEFTVVSGNPSRFALQILTGRGRYPLGTLQNESVAREHRDALNTFLEGEGESYDYHFE